jgi:hypothetical protein
MMPMLFFFLLYIHICMYKEEDFFIQDNSLTESGMNSTIQFGEEQLDDNQQQ